MGTYTPVPQFPAPASGIRRCYWALKTDFLGDDDAESAGKWTITDGAFTPFTVYGVVGVDLDFRLNIPLENTPPASPQPADEIGVCTFRRTS
jgi:hypothetical protein